MRRDAYWLIALLILVAILMNLTLKSVPGISPETAHPKSPELVKRKSDKTRRYTVDGIGLGMVAAHVKKITGSPTEVDEGICFGDATSWSWRSRTTFVLFTGGGSFTPMGPVFEVSGTHLVGPDGRVAASVGDRFTAVRSAVPGQWRKLDSAKAGRAEYLVVLEVKLFEAVNLTFERDRLSHITLRTYHDSKH